MLMRILGDHPGPTFTRNLDKKFVDATKELLRGCRDASVHHILTETLELFETHKGYDEGLNLIIEMWRKEKTKSHKNYVVGIGAFPVGREFLPGMEMAPSANWLATQTPMTWQPSPPPQQMQHMAHHQSQHNYFARSHSSRRTLPAPADLANRLEEARTSAKLLEQVVASTPPAEVLSNDLIKEFADRCNAASQSIQGYMTVTDPAPDNDTMESLIDTNEQLQTALNQHQRAALNARKHLGLGAASENSSPDSGAQQQQQGRSSRRRTGQAASSSRSNQELPALPGSSDAAGGSSSKGKGKGKDKAPEASSYGGAAAGSSRSAANGKSRQDEVAQDDDDDDGADPFRDPVPEPSRSSSVAGRSGAAAGGGGSSGEPPRLAYEPFHPGFGSSEDKDDEAGKFHMRGGAGDRKATDDDDEYGAEDAYRANPNKDPVYRY